MIRLFDEIPYLENEYIILHRIEEEDAGAIARMSSDPNVTAYLPTYLFEYGFEDKREAVRQMYKPVANDTGTLMLGIYPKDAAGNCSGEMAGIVELYNYEPNWNKVSIGYRLDEAYWGQGIAGRTVELLLSYIFDRTDVKRVTAHVIDGNVASMAVLKKAGFTIRRMRVKEDWGHSEPDIVNKYIIEKWTGTSYVKIGNGKKIMAILPGLALKSTLGGADSIAKNYAIFKDYTIYLFDDRAKLGEGYTLRERAGDVASDMKRLGIKHAYVFGASMGGMVGQYLAIDHPDLVEKLYISASCSRPNASGQKTLERWLELAEAGNLKDLTDDMIESIYSPEIVRQFGQVLKDGTGEVSQEEMDKFIILIKAIMQVNTYDELDRIICPVYVSGAEGDRVLTTRGVDEIIDRLNCEHYIYGPEYGHGVYDEAPDHRQRILDFFEE